MTMASNRICFAGLKFSENAKYMIDDRTYEKNRTGFYDKCKQTITTR